jgi:hypothetical protein
VKSHPWLSGVPWEKLQAKTIDSPYIPTVLFSFGNFKSIEDNLDYRQQISDDESEEDELVQQNMLLLRRNSVQSLYR